MHTELVLNWFNQVCKDFFGYLDPIISIKSQLNLYINNVNGKRILK